MLEFKRTGRLLSVAALAASTTLTAPGLGYAQVQTPLRVAQASDETPPPPPPATDEAPAEPAPAAQQEAPAEIQAPAAQEPAAPSVEEPAQPVAPEPAAPAEPDVSAPSAPEEPATPKAPAPQDAAPAPEPTAPTAEPSAPASEPEAPASEPSASQAEPAPDAAPAAAAPKGEPAEPAPEAAPAPAATPDAPAATDSGAAAPATAPADTSAGSDAPAVKAPIPGSPRSAKPSAKPSDAQAPQSPTETGTDQQAQGARPARRGERAPEPVPADVQSAPVEQGKIGASDARVQQLAEPVEVRSATEEQGRRVDRRRERRTPEGVDVVKRDGDREIVKLGTAAAVGAVAGAAASYFIRSNDDDRLSDGAQDTYTEELPRGRQRETIVRPNGVQVVTITDRYGDVIQRSRIMPDGREVVLFYAPEDRSDRRRPDYYRDVGRDLPPLRVSIPEDEYIVDVDRPDEDLYYDTIVAPPVETVERIYTVDEVRRSERVRDKVRRIDLNTINFDSGSAAISDAEARNLKALADVVSRVIDENPDETFLIEGHTDAVGSDLANLALSDKRAESVAAALTTYFDIPPENLVTQGYGEQYLKVKTQSASRENRRVTLRRITPLVKPVNAASN